MPTLLMLCAASPATIAGIGRAKDGDSLTVGGKEVRLFGIDAPEFDQSCTRNGQSWACGAEARDRLAELVTGKRVFCISMGVDQHDRTLGRCTVGSTDVNKMMVALGYAVGFRQYSSDYVSSETTAKLNKRGIWAGTFQQPSDYRRGGEASPRPARRAGKALSSDWAGRARANCDIKGNRNRRGQWIYHVPGMPYYDRTRPEEIFCSEAEASAAGYRRAIVK